MHKHTGLSVVASHRCTHDQPVVIIMIQVKMIAIFYDQVPPFVGLDSFHE